MGTVVSFRVAEASATTAAATEAAAEAAVARAQAGLRRADEVFSTWQPQSPVSRLRRGEIELEQAPPEVAQVLELCRRARDASQGWFDPWRMPGGLDPTGLVKGWAAQRALQELRRAGPPGALINAGGDIAVFGEPEPSAPWRIGIRDPRDEQRIVLTVELRGAGAVATSGAYERGAHVLQPQGGAPARGLLSATVIGHDLAFADALATALFASGGRLLPHLGRLAGYHGLTIDVRGVPHTSPGLALSLPVAA
jgi:FAD:protein FMN transferase